MSSESSNNYWLLWIIVIALILSGWLFVAYPTSFGRITVLSYMGTTFGILASFILAGRILIYGAKKIQEEDDGREGVQQLELPISISEWVTIFLQITITVFLIAVTLYLGTKILYSIGAIPERWVIYENQQKDISLQNTDQKNLEDKRVMKNDDLDSKSEGTLLEILSILAIFGGILAYVFNTVIREEMKVEYEKIGEEGRHFTEAQMLKTGGLTEYYKFSIQRDNVPQGVDVMLYDLSLLKALNSAIYFTDEGIKVIVQLDGKVQKKERNELLICILKNNFSWLYLEKLNFIDSHELSDDVKRKERDDCISVNPKVLKYIQYVHNNAYKHDKRHIANWVDTYNKVQIKFPIR